MIEEPRRLGEQLVQQPLHTAEVDGLVLRHRTLMKEAMEQTAALPPGGCVTQEGKLVYEASASSKVSIRNEYIHGWVALTALP